MWEIHEEQHLSERGKQAWVEEVGSQASADPPGSSGVGLILQNCPQGEKKARTLYPSLVGGVLPLSSEHSVGNVAVFSQK